MTIYRASLRTGRTLAIDLYIADVLERISNRSRLPRPGFPNLTRSSSQSGWGKLPIRAARSSSSGSHRLGMAPCQAARRLPPPHHAEQRLRVRPTEGASHGAPGATRPLRSHSYPAFRRRWHPALPRNERTDLLKFALMKFQLRVSGSWPPKLLFEAQLRLISDLVRLQYGGQSGRLNILDSSLGVCSCFYCPTLTSKCRECLSRAAAQMHLQEKLRTSPLSFPPSEVKGIDEFLFSKKTANF